jgi:LuxR family maltose regulon positive regulatory protein
MVYWHEGNLREAESTLIEAEKDTRGSDNLYAQLTSEIFLARSLASAGKLRAAAAKYPGIIQRGPQIPVVALAYQDLAFIHYEWNELEKAEAYLQQGMDLSKRTRNEEFQIAGLILQVYLNLARQDWAAASKTVDQACDMSKKFSAHTQSRCAALRALVAIKIGDLKSTSLWLEQNEEDIDSHPLYRFSGLIRPRLLIAQGKLDEAADKLDVLSAAALEAGWGYALIVARVLQALAASSPDTAIDFLEDALQMAASDGYIRTFLDVGSNLVPLLQQIANRGKASRYARQLLSQAENKTPLVIEKSALVEPLSERELEVLKLVAVGLSNREIGRKLFISPGTAKTHIHNLCGKLNVRNRTEAASRAKELGLV